MQIATNMWVAECQALKQIARRSSCRKKKPLNEQDRMSVKESPLALRQVNLFERKWTTSVRVSMAPDRPSRQSQLDCRKLAAPALSYLRLKTVRHLILLGNRQSEI